MLTLYQYSFNVGYPKPYIHILAYCKEEAIDKFKTLYPDVKWFELSFQPKVVKIIETEDNKIKKEIKHIPTQDEAYESWAKGIILNMELRKEGIEIEKQYKTWAHHFDSI